jgi:dihydrofolate reductase
MPKRDRKVGRKVILGLGISLDGYIARPDGAVDFLFMPKDYHPHWSKFMRRIDTAIMGRKTYEVGKKLSGGKIDTMGIKTYVMSQTLPPGELEGLIFTRKSAKEIVTEIRASSGKDIWMMGGGELARVFLAEDLIDELYLGIIPTLIGKGIPLFPPGYPQREFTLVRNTTYSRGMIALIYERAPKAKRKASRGKK